ncbi:hypothetical protein [Amycolatopsis thermoflava]|uniref:hypothetical protein n=1 Tax=Amycolatopsis thermoflava TaxID=84480 RepID=UPI00380C84C3
MLVALAVLAGVFFFAVGRWGRRNAAGLVPPSLSAAGREKKERGLRTGALSCQIAGVVFVLLGVAALVLGPIAGLTGN